MNTFIFHASVEQSVWSLNCFEYTLRWISSSKPDLRWRSRGLLLGSQWLSVCGLLVLRLSSWQHAKRPVYLSLETEGCCFLAKGNHLDPELLHNRGAVSFLQSRHDRSWGRQALLYSPTSFASVRCADKLKTLHFLFDSPLFGWVSSYIVKHHTFWV